MQTQEVTNPYEEFVTVANGIVGQVQACLNALDKQAGDEVDDAIGEDLVELHNSLELARDAAQVIIDKGSPKNAE